MNPHEQRIPSLNERAHYLNMLHKGAIKLDKGQVANALMKAYCLHEESWNGERYNISIAAACREVIMDEDWAHLGYLLLTAASNDTLDWCKKHAA